jgi:hypothetical protein
MANVKLEVSISSSISEATANKVLAAAGIPKGAATIVRDATGKVIQVVIKLPDTAADAAVAAISATPGVADIQTSDLPAGTTGCDGSLASVDALIASGFQVQNDPMSPVVVTYNADGTMTFTGQGGAGIRYANYGVIPAVPSYPQALTVEIRAKVSGDFAIYATFANNHNRALGGSSNGDVYIRDQVAYTTATALAAWPYNDDEFHVFKYTVDSNSLMTCFVDGISVASATLAVNSFVGNLLDIQFYLRSSQTSITVDYFRWTAV